MCVHTHVCLCVCVHACALGLGQSLAGLRSELWSQSWHILCREPRVGWLGQQAQLGFHEAFSCLQAGHRAESDAFQRLIKALPNASLHHFNDY